MSSLLTLDQLINDSQQINRSLHYIPHNKTTKDFDSIKINTFDCPISINRAEVLFFQNFIQQYQPKCGLEIGTGTGVSALIIGQAMQNYGGFYTTIDSYIEEKRNACNAYDFNHKINNQSKTYPFLLTLQQYYNLSNVFFIQDKSPINIFKYVNRNELDFVFIDAHHTDESLILDLLGILPFINSEKCSIFLHDTHCFKNLAKDFILKIFNKPWTNCIEKDPYNLSVIQIGTYQQ